MNSLPVTSARNRRRTADLQASIFSIQLRKYREQTSNSNQEGIADEDICVSYREDVNEWVIWLEMAASSITAAGILPLMSVYF